MRASVSGPRWMNRPYRSTSGRPYRRLRKIEPGRPEHRRDLLQEQHHPERIPPLRHPHARVDHHQVAGDRAGHAQFLEEEDRHDHRQRVRAQQHLRALIEGAGDEEYHGRLVSPCRDFSLRPASVSARSLPRRLARTEDTHCNVLMPRAMSTEMMTSETAVCALVQEIVHAKSRSAGIQLRADEAERRVAAILWRVGRAR